MQDPPFLERRLLTAAEAARYFHLPVARFVGLGVGRVSFGATVLYDRAALDHFLDGLSGLDRAQGADDPDAALARFAAHLPGAPGRP